MQTVSQLREVFDTCGQETLMIGDGILVSLFGGRVIGLSADDRGNAIWANPLLASAESARGLFASTDWANPGGDRIWISPERETHLIDPENPSGGFAIPPTVDPGGYRVIAADDRCVCLENTATVPFRRSNSAAQVSWRLTITALDTPPFPVGDLAVCGYRTTVELHCDGERVVDPAIWRLLQVPAGGRITVPTRDETPAYLLGGTPGYVQDGASIHADIPSPASYKFAVHASESTGELRYRQDYADYSDMIVRRFDVDPEGYYTDTPCDGRPDTGYIVQVYVDDGGFGDFGEMEHHSVAISPGETNTSDTSDTCDTWLIRGDREQVNAAGA